MYHGLSLSVFVSIACSRFSVCFSLFLISYDYNFCCKWYPLNKYDHPGCENANQHRPICDKPARQIKSLFMVLLLSLNWRKHPRPCSVLPVRKRCKGNRKAITRSAFDSQSKTAQSARMVENLLLIAITHILIFSVNLKAFYATRTTGAKMKNRSVGVCIHT